MIRLELKNFLTGTMVRRPLYRAVCKDGATRMGYLCFMVKKHWFRPSTEAVYLREQVTGRLYKFRSESLAIWTMTVDTNGRPICNGDYVMRTDSRSDVSILGQICYCTDIAGFVFRTVNEKYERTEPMYEVMSVTCHTYEVKVKFSYTIVDKPKLK